MTTSEGQTASCRSRSVPSRPTSRYPLAQTTAAPPGTCITERPKLLARDAPLPEGLESLAGEPADVQRRRWRLRRLVRGDERDDEGRAVVRCPEGERSGSVDGRRLPLAP